MAASLPVAFVPWAVAQTGGPVVAAIPALLRGAVAGLAPESKSETGALGPLGVAALACGVCGVAKKRRQPTASARRFFGSATPPSKATSYKDFNDKFLGSADLGFDPFNLAVKGGTFDSSSTAVAETTYYNYRESEVKHGRFAMGAFLAIFFESADRSAILHQLGQVKIEDKLDGTLGLDEVQAPVLLIGLGYQALAEYNLQQKKTVDKDTLNVPYNKDRIPGNLGFDPLGLGSGPSADIIGLHNTEVNAGRLAMIGVTTFLAKEFLLKDETLAQKIFSDSAI
jgi:hypothetical protein